MKRMLTLLLTAAITLSQPALAAKIQQQGIKTLADCIAGGATGATCLPLSSQVWDSSGNQQLSTTLASLTPLSYNVLVNSAFDYWQAGTSVTVANGASTYQADQWYVNNAMGAAGVLTYDQLTSGLLAGSKYAAEVKVSTAPTTAGSTGINLVQPLDNANSLQVYNQTASFAVQVESEGNVNQVTLAVGYATTEVKPTLSNTIATATCAVSTGAYTLCQLPNVALGTSPTTSGIYFVEVSASGVSSGHVTDFNNGFKVQQAILNLGAAAASFKRAGLNPQAELAMCQRFYESDYDIGTTIGSSWLQTGAIGVATGGNDMPVSAAFKATKRAVAVMTVWDNVGTANSVYEVITGGHKAISSYRSDQAGFTYISAAGTLISGDVYMFHWLADARI